MTNWLVKWLPECEDIITVAGSDEVKDTSVEDTSVKAKDLTAEGKAKAKDC